VAVKINDETANYLLPPEMNALHSIGAQMLPESSFGRCHAMAQFYRSCLLL